jgi:ergothioneine biosynthesis protein EgtC
MCRFALYLGDPLRLEALLTDPPNSIIHQSMHSHEGADTVNGDGFGVAWYAPEICEQPGLFKAISPAWNNRNLLSLARITRSPCIVAHVRAATPGLPVTQLNCHPFTWEQLAFMHNGAVAGFADIRRRILDRLSDQAFAAIHGSTDSEHLFGMLIDRLRSNGSTSPTERLTSALRATISDIEQLRQAAGIQPPSRLNLAVTDGVLAVVSRFHSDESERSHSLYVTTSRPSFCEEAGLPVGDGADRNRSVIVASEPLDDDVAWKQVPGNHLVVVDEHREVDLVPIV